jgi:hypothetical protein
MSNYSPMETLKLAQAAKVAALAENQAKLVEKNKAAAREQLLRMQIQYTRQSPK